MAKQKHPFDRTAPWRSRWDQEDAEFVASDSEWCDRFAARLIALSPGLDHFDACTVALDLASNDALRACTPERVAEDMAAGPAPPSTGAS